MGSIEDLLGIGFISLTSSLALARISLALGPSSVRILWLAWAGFRFIALPAADAQSVFSIVPRSRMSSSFVNALAGSLLTLLRKGSAALRRRGPSDGLGITGLMEVRSFDAKAAPWRVTSLVRPWGKKGTE
eukprot:GHVO01004039.1.p1 GENE.GHVO01004039.1~~GHVO01004039.1.p1  ORF type:complete len:131 (+),score=1.29 GHVO01004039.1:246-638(+)